MTTRKIVQGRCRWAFVSTPNTRFNPIYSIDVEIPKETHKDYLEQGFPVKDNDGFYMTIKRIVKKGKPLLFDAKKNQTSVMIGNGSMVRVQYQEYEFEDVYGIHRGFELEAVQILDLIRHENDMLLEDFLIES